MKLLAKIASNSFHVAIQILALVCAFYLLLLLLSFGEPSTPFPKYLGVILLFVILAPALLLIAVANARSAMPMFPLLGATGAAFDAIACLFFHLQALANQEATPGISAFEAYLCFFFFVTAPLAIFLLATFSSMRRFKQLVHPR